MAYSSSDQSICSNYSVLNCSTAEDFLVRYHYPLRICFIGEITCDILEAAKVFNLSVVTSENGAEYIRDDHTLFVFSSFECEAFDYIMQFNLKGRVMGAPALLEAAERNQQLPLRSRPILSLTMKDVVVCFTGITDKSEAMEMMYMIRSMGGSVRQGAGQSITHLIAGKTTGSTYEYANVFRVPAMSPEWVYQCWNRRYLPGTHATDNDLMAFRQKPFIKCNAAFLGFSAKEEAIAMKDFVFNGGQVSHPLDPKCTHWIVDDATKCNLSQSPPTKCLVVGSEWLWTCVQQIMRVSEVSYFLPLELREKRREVRKRQLEPCVRSFDDKENSNCANLSNGLYSFVSALSSDNSEHGATPAKVKKLDNSISGVQALDQTSPKAESDLENNNVSPIQSAEAKTSGDSATPSEKESSSDVKFATNRRTASFLELLQTEENYVKILETILGIKEEAMSNDQPGGALLTETEAKVIFSNIIPICEAHRTILQDLRTVERLWNGSPSIGEVYTQITADLSKAYAPYVSTFEESKEMVKECEEKKPRFHAFTKIIRGRPECGRQALPDLMIRPVQRLGSTVLLLREIKKHTPSDHPDYLKLQSALESLSEVLSVINEDKRKMETLCTVFDVFNLIEYCPPDIIASHRSLVMQMETVQLTEEGPSQIGDHIMLFIFTDVLLIAKKKNKVVALTKKPSEELSDKILKLTHGKPYKFLDVVPHTFVRRLLNVVDNQNIRNVLTIVTRRQNELRETHIALRLVDGSGDKVLLLENWCRALAAYTCTTDPFTFLSTIAAEECGVGTSEVEETQMQKASRMMVKTQCLFGSVFGKSGSTTKPNKLRSPFTVPTLKIGSVRSPSCSDLTDTMAVDEDCQELKTSSLNQNTARKL